MRTYTILIIFCIISFRSFGQQAWSPIHQDKLYSYRKTENFDKNIFNPNGYYGSLDFNPIVQNVFITGFSTVGSDSVFMLNKRAKPIGTISNSFTNNQLSYVWDFEYPGFLNNEIRTTSFGEYFFQGNDTFLLKPQAQLFDSWIFKDTVTATVIAIEPFTQWNVPDSLKTILLSNNDTILLSRNFGMLKFPDPDSVGNYIEILGLQKDTLSWGLRTPDFWDTYNFNVGDVLMYEWNESAYPNLYNTGCIKLNIVQKNWLPNGIEYGVDELGYRESNFLIPFNRNSSPIRFTIDSCQYINGFHPNLMSFSHSAEQIPSFSGWNIRSFAIASLDSNNLIRKDIYRLELQPDSILFVRYEEIYRYKVGIGFYEYIYSGFEGAAASSLIGYVKDGDTIGTVYSDSLIIALSNEAVESGSENFAIVYPNPSTEGQLNIKLNEVQTGKIDVTVFNINGQLLYDEIFSGGEETLDLSIGQRFVSGFYIVKVKSSGREQYLKWQCF
jgi:hypothetical protein